MNPTTKYRITSIDLWRGIIMVIMALDHVRDYFHEPAFIYNSTDPRYASLAIFFTRWITHFCAPAFSFLAGISAFIGGKRKTKNELSAFLFKRGLWLIFIEVTVINFGWLFNYTFTVFVFQVIWALGFSMIILSLLIYLPLVYILIFSCVLIFCHNLLDFIHWNDSVPWSLFHQSNHFKLPHNINLLIGYPVVPWVAVMSLGYYFGSYYDASVDKAKRQKLFNVLGIACLFLFMLSRAINMYGDPHPYHNYNNLSKTLISFLAPSKYPPSLIYLLMTLGPTFLFLANTEQLKGNWVDFFSTFGRVPFFYYVLHIYLIHLTAMLLAPLCGFSWHKLILLPTWVSDVKSLRGFGFHLWVVYVVWVCMVVLLYPLCKWFDQYKMNNRQKWWLSYL